MAQYGALSKMLDTRVGGDEKQERSIGQMRKGRGAYVGEVDILDMKDSANSFA